MPRSQATDLASPRPSGSAVQEVKDFEQPSGRGINTGTGASGRKRPLSLAAAYARVSSERQEKEQTIESQVDALRRAAEQRGLSLPSDLICIDDGYSGTTLERPALDRLRDLVSEGACDLVLVVSPDRLARRYAYQVVVIDELQRAGCSIVFLNHAFGDSPEQQMLLQIQGVFAEYERAVIQERLRRGRLYWARQGRVNWGGNATYGYRCVPKSEAAPLHLTVDDAEAAIVRQLYHWLVDEQLSSHGIAKRLNARGVPTRSGTARWSQSTVVHILSNPIYIGEGWYNRYRTADAIGPRRARGLKDCQPGNGRSRRLRPKEEWIVVPAPAILDPDLWRLAQEQLVANRVRATRNNTKHHYLLRSLLICGRCGRRMIGAWSSVSSQRYICSACYPRTSPGACDGRSVKADWVEEQVWSFVSGLLSDPALLRARYEESRGDPAVDAAAERERERLERKLSAMDREVARLIDAYQVGVIDLDDLKQRRDRVADHGRALRERLGEIQRQRREREQEIRLLEGLEGFCASICDALKEPSSEMIQKIVRLAVDRILAGDDRLVIKHIVPAMPFRLRPGSTWPTCPPASTTTRIWKLKI